MQGFSGHSERVHYESSEWCAAALSGPGGRFLRRDRGSSGNSDSSSMSITTTSSSDSISSDPGSSAVGPLGVWCALPLSGRFMVPTNGDHQHSSSSLLESSISGRINETTAAAIAKVTGLPHLSPTGDLPGTQHHTLSFAERKQQQRHAAQNGADSEGHSSDESSSDESVLSMSRTSKLQLLSFVFNEGTFFSNFSPRSFAHSLIIPCFDCTYIIVLIFFFTLSPLRHLLGTHCQDHAEASRLTSLTLNYFPNSHLRSAVSFGKPG